ncbi:MAG: hypothetical protein CL512_03825 [Actinobacteria bacterium]|nr:hypothetical protein [Actinomycetota bacterium]
MFKDTEDIKLIELVQAKTPSECALKEIINRHSGIFISIISSHFEKGNFMKYGLELIEEKDYYIYQAVLKYDSKRKTKFSTFLGNEARWLCLNTYNKRKKTERIFNHEKNNLEFLMKTHAAPESKSIDMDCYDRILEIANGHSDKRVSKIFKLRYVDGKQNKLMPWKDISKKMNLSIQGCINIHNAAIKYIRKVLEKEIDYVK